ncbi:protein of unknown function DUF503 [Desulfurobacterium thermolithotrophum DSM 11699]|uniref:DUF503 domain-containing protein n=1 Tax=Desulfurobacterium thermolithotrophum (strain DSM 11699 / BSA) TaxID=868864 RepID=F0S1P1_DESTD|nr:DUF503 domain-containing protein [Desulfurobacterium thermolithotrophum]ADY72896.1 protein of unknown function DUF503 [Desulfurobacterium thermolithotrophum DSM 11699]
MAAAIGFLEVHLRIPEAHSLKEKRGVVKRIIERLKNKFNVSVSEIGEQDKWQSSVIGVVTIASSKKVVDATLEKVVVYIEDLYPGKVINYYKEIF